MVATKGASSLGIDLWSYVERHMDGEWQDCHEEDIEDNLRGVVELDTVLTAHNAPQGRIWVLSDMDLHHPPCQSLDANKAFYALAMLAYNLLQAIKLLHLPDKEQCVRIRTLVHILMLIPVHFKRHARQLKAVCCVASNWLFWWNGFIGQLLKAQQKLRFCSS